MRSFYMLIPFAFMAIMALFIQSCCRGPTCETAGIGGGQDAVAIDLPFAMTFASKCVQGVGGSYSHSYESTAYDLDFDTPNNEQVPIYAPVGGIAYVHDSDRSRGFGVHINIDLGDGTYIVLGHLDEAFVENGSEVAAGQLLGYEGTTGYSTGDHVHIGRHDGDAARNATYGDSIEGLSLLLYDQTSSAALQELMVGEVTCDLSRGHVYASQLATPLWHPDGTLVKTPSESTVYLIEGGERRAFWTEDAFWSRGYDFADVALIDDDELDCYSVGSNITGVNEIAAYYERGEVWLVFPEDGERQRVQPTGWQAVLKSWGVVAASYDDLPGAADAYLTAYAERDGYAAFRSGTLVSEASSSTVYVISDGIAMPISSWEVFVLMGFGDRTVLEVDDGVVNAVIDRVGDCATNAYCVTREDVTTCGGPSETLEGSYASLSVSWTTPDGLPVDRITMSGEYTRASGWSGGWQALAESRDLATVTYERSDAAGGDALRFSVEYERNGATSWSCLAPYPPGTVQGEVSAQWEGQDLFARAVADPSSSGCGLQIKLPAS